MRRLRLIKILAAIVLIIILGASILIWAYSENSKFNPPAEKENFEYLNIPSGARIYKGEIEVDDRITIPSSHEVPYLHILLHNFTYEDAKRLATELFSMKIVEIYNTSDFYHVKGVNASLSLRKSGYKVFYDRIEDAIEKVPVEMSDEDVIEITNGYLERFNELLPRNVEIKPHDVVAGRTLYGEGNENGVTYTKVVRYECHYEGIPIGLILEVEIDAQGNLTDFETMPVTVENSGTARIVDFTEVVSWMKEQLPVPVEPEKIRSVRLTDVQFLYIPVPLDGGKLVPVYMVSIHIDTEGGGAVNYTLEIGGIQK